MKETPLSNRRLVHLDVAKALGMLLVITGHIWTTSPNMRQFIYSFHIPLFIFIAGYLYRPVSFGIRLKKDLRSLLIPYLIVNGVCLAVRLTSGMITVPDYQPLEHLWKMLVAIVLGESFHTAVTEPVCGPSWFILSIFFLHILFGFLRKEFKMKRWILLLIIVVSVGLTYEFRAHDIQWIGMADATIMAIPFYVLGYGCKRASSFNQPLKTPILLIILGATAAITFVSYRWNGMVDMNTLDYGTSLPLFFMTAFSGIGMVLTLSELLCRVLPSINNPAKTMAAGTIVILGFHRFAIVAANHVCSMTPVASVIAAVVIWMAFYPFIRLLAKYFPPLLGYRKA